MKPLQPNQPTDDTGLPGFRTWRSVYFFVLGSFAVWIGLLMALSWMFE
jgi:hypothetical protein